MRVAILSKGRPNFSASKVFKNPIVFVEPQDMESYQKYNPDMTLINIRKDNQGIVYVRNFILDYMGEEVFCKSDDDIESFYQREGTKFVPVSSDIVLGEIEKFMSENNIAACGLPPKQTSWYYKGLVKKNMKIFNIIFLNGFLLKPLRYDENISNGQDIDLCFQLIRSGRGSYGYFKFAYQNASGGSLEGGLQDNLSKLAMQERIRKKLECIEYMNRKWGSKSVTAIIKNNKVSHRVNWFSKG